MREFLRKVFRKKRPPTDVDIFISDIRDELDKINKTYRMITTLTKKVKDLSIMIEDLEKRMTSFSQDEKRLDKVAHDLVQVLSHILTMDHKLSDLLKAYESIKNKIPSETTRKVLKGPETEKKGTKQFELSLGK